MANPSMVTLSAWTCTTKLELPPVPSMIVSPPVRAEPVAFAPACAPRSVSDLPIATFSLNVPGATLIVSPAVEAVTAVLIVPNAVVP